MKDLRYLSIIFILLYAIRIYFVSINFEFENPLLVWFGIDIVLLLIIGFVLLIRYYVIKYRQMKRKLNQLMDEQDGFFI